MVDRPLTSRENWFLSLVNLPLWRIVFINTRWRDWSRRTPAPLLTKIRMETNTARKLTSCMSWKLILLWGFSAIDLPVTKRKKRELIVSVIWRHLSNERGKKQTTRAVSSLVSRYILLYCTPSVCCRDVLYEFAVNFTLSLMILKDDLKTLETWHYRFLEPIYLFFERKKNLRGKNDLLMFKIETYNISIVNKMD